MKKVFFVASAGSTNRCPFQKGTWGNFWGSFWGNFWGIFRGIKRQLNYYPDILFLKIVRAMTTMQDGAEKQQVMSMSFELLRELDPKRYEEMTEDMKKELQELLLGHQTVSVTESEVDRHSESNQCLDDNMEATAVIGLVQELESQVRMCRLNQFGIALTKSISCYLV